VSQTGIGTVWEIQDGRGRKPRYDQAKRDAIVAATLETKPKGMTHWSCRLMAKAQRVSKNTVNRLWQLHQLKPHQQRTFKLSRDTKFIEKLTDVVGLYLNPPQKALVLCVDEKSQIQALDRTQPGLPLKKCHRADQNQPLAGTSKPASLRREFHSSFLGFFKRCPTAR
jgi:hypothetical protein